jgi:uncharacterized protein YprB with RNaseH-like and TPR domain
VIGGLALRERLSELARERRAGSPGSVPAPPRAWVDARSPHALSVEAYLPGGEWRDERGAVFVHERLRSEIERPRADWGALGTPPEEEETLALLSRMDLGGVLFLDLETGGFSGSPVFLAGTMRWNGSDFVLRQYFARHYGEESALLRALAEASGDVEALVTFNGKSYDVPFLRDRARVHAAPLHIPPVHVDLLHPSRRRWRGCWMDCRLQTLELYVCRRRRGGDVPSDEVPGLYHDFVRRGDPYRLIPVFHHNLLDVITMHEILRVLCGPGDVPIVRRPSLASYDPPSIALTLR